MIDRALVQREYLYVKTLVLEIPASFGEESGPHEAALAEAGHASAQQIKAASGRVRFVMAAQPTRAGVQRRRSRSGT